MKWPHRDRGFWRRMVGYVLLGLAANQFIVFTGNRSLRAAEAAESEAEAAWVKAEALGDAVRRSRARTLHVSDSLQALVVSAEARADEAAHRASQAIVIRDSITVEIGASRAEFRSALTEQLQSSFDRLSELDDERHLQSEIALSETQGEVVEIRQALRTSNRIIEGLRAQIARDAMAQASLEEAIKASQIEADRWKTAANPGFVLKLWKDLPKFLVVGGAAYLYGRSGG